MKTFLFLTFALLTVAVWAAADDDGMAAAREALLSPAKPVAETVALRDTKITAARAKYNYKEAVAILTDDVVVDDARFHLTADRLFVFFAGTNDFSQLVVMGNVVVSNENRRAFCDKAVFTKDDGRLVMVGHAKLVNIAEDGKQSNAAGDKITIWTKEGVIDIFPRPTLTFPAGASDGLKGMMQ